MALPNSTFLQKFLPTANSTVNVAALTRRLNAVCPNANVSITTSAITLTEGTISVSVPMPTGVTLQIPAVNPQSYANANAKRDIKGNVVISS